MVSEVKVIMASFKRSIMSLKATPLETIYEECSFDNEGWEELSDSFIEKMCGDKLLENVTPCMCGWTSRGKLGQTGRWY